MCPLSQNIFSPRVVNFSCLMNHELHDCSPVLGELVFLAFYPPFLSGIGPNISKHIDLIQLRYSVAITLPSPLAGGVRAVVTRTDRRSLTLFAILSHLYQSTLVIISATDVIYMRDQGVSSGVGLSCDYH